jgi:hypothetical protein
VTQPASTIKPLAISAGLRFQRVGDDTMVYDDQNQIATVLNRSAALVRSYCDGSTPVGAMAGRLSEDLGVDASDDVVLLALSKLADNGLVSLSEEASVSMARRRLLVTLGVGVVALPLVESIIAPLPAAAASQVVPTTTTPPVTTTTSDGRSTVT